MKILLFILILLFSFTAKSVPPFEYVDVQGSNQLQTKLNLGEWAGPADPVSTVPAIGYNISLGKMRCYENGVWKDCISTVLDIQGDIRAYGAVCDGVTDDTTAIQAALTAGTVVYIPAGTCISSTLTVANDYTQIYGNGPNSILKFKAGVTSAALIVAGAHPVNIHDFTMDGGLTTSCKTNCSTSTSRDGITLRSSLISYIHHMRIHGFDNRALYFLDTATDRLAHAEVDNTVIYNSYVGVQYSVTYTEYVRLTALDVSYCLYGVLLNSGNHILSSSKINDNGTGVRVYGTGQSNEGHGIIVGNLINHSATYSIYIVDNDVGEIITGNVVIDGPLFFSNADGVMVTSNLFDIQSYTLTNGTRNTFTDNTIKTVSTGGAYNNTITHTTDQTIFRNNPYFDGSGYHDDICVDIAGDAAGCGTAQKGFVVVDAADTTTIVTTKAVTTRSQIKLRDCSAYETGVYDAVGATTCNTDNLVFPKVTSPVAETSFTITTYAYATGAATAPATNPLCVCFEID